MLTLEDSQQFTIGLFMNSAIHVPLVFAKDSFGYIVPPPPPLPNERLGAKKNKTAVGVRWTRNGGGRERVRIIKHSICISRLPL